MTENIEQFDWTVTEERKAQLSLDHKRLVIDHSLVLHRDKQSIEDLQQMLEALLAAGAPKEATIEVRANDKLSDKTFFPHLRVYARWSEDVAND